MSSVKYLIDTDILFSKKFLNYRGEGVVTSATVYEFLTVTREKYLYFYQKGEKDRAKGYLKLLNLVLGEIKNSIIDITGDDFIKAGRLVFERDLNVGDAINVIVAIKLGLIIVSGDKDYERVKDLVKVIKV